MYAHCPSRRFNTFRRAADRLRGIQLSHRPAAVETYRKAGVPESWLNGLAGVLLLGAAGLVVGLWWPPAGFVTPIGLVAYFALAVGFHVRAHDGAHAVTPAVLAVLAAAVVALHAVSS